MTAASWLSLVGALLGAVGSAVRAWFTLKEYQDLIQRAKIPELINAQIRLYRSWVGYRWITELMVTPFLAFAWIFLRLLSMIWRNHTKLADKANRAKNSLKNKVKEDPIVVLFQAQLAVAENLELIRKSGEDDARRLGELANQAFAWMMILLGAVAVFISSVIRLVSA